jgi:hypothetical protein
MIEQGGDPEKWNALEFFEEDFRPEEIIEAKRRRSD